MDNTKPLLGFVGVGVMGRPMARRLLEAGYGVVVFDPNAQAMAELKAAGAQSADSAKGVADQASIVFTSMPTVAIFKQVGMGAGGVIDGRAVKTVVDLSTVGGTATREVAAALQARGIDMVDAPISGGAAGAKAGTLAVMVAGKPAVVETVMPMFQVFGKPFVVGPEPGQAQLMKLLNNMLSSTAFAVTAEAYVAGVRGGLDPEVMMSVFNAGSGRNNATSDKFPKYVLPRSFDFGFPIAERLQGHRTGHRRMPGAGRADVGGWPGASAMAVGLPAGRRQEGHDLDGRVPGALVRPQA